MARQAEACVRGEQILGHDAELIDVDQPATWEGAEVADVHVCHTHFPENFRERISKPYRVVFVPHGTPEHVVEMTVAQYEKPGYAPADGWMLLRHWLREADAVVTFWERHAAIYQAMVPKERKIHFAPMGVDREFWAGGAAAGKYAGEPAVWTSENQHRIKWSLDVLLAWPELIRLVPRATLHCHYIPWPLHRIFVDLANSNGAAYRAYLSASTYTHDQLRSIWKGFDFFLSPVRYGDHNQLFMQAAASGPRTISYTGNQYADYWIPEGDQRQVALALAAIFKGDVAPREQKLPVPSLTDTSSAMVAVYEGLF